MSALNLHILQHSLGVDEYGRGKQYRNRFVTGPSSKDFAACIALVEAGLMCNHGNYGKLTGGDHLFTVTSEGIDYVAFSSPRPPKVSRSRQRYLDYLEVGDMFESFHHYLTYLTKKARGEVS